MKMSKISVATAALALCMGASSAMAVTITPTNTKFSAKGVSVVKPGFLPAVTCNVEFIGTTNNNTATITAVNITGGGSCALAGTSGLPWTLTATSTTTGTVSGVKFTVAGVNCSSSPVTVNGAWSNSANTLTLTPNQPVGSCTIQSLSVSPNPAFTVLP
ncbi:alkane oxidation protein activator PraB [Metapseudomonas otitidis]|uniref:alkane oxidation protein activator PraB n=1 Tax=Metapseudomonas otitidis TaxID=319939 RepID=UPI00366BA45B